MLSFPVPSSLTSWNTSLKKTIRTLLGPAVCPVCPRRTISQTLSGRVWRLPRVVVGISSRVWANGRRSGASTAFLFRWPSGSISGSLHTSFWVLLKLLLYVTLPAFSFSQHLLFKELQSDRTVAGTARRTPALLSHRRGVEKSVCPATELQFPSTGGPNVAAARGVPERCIRLPCQWHV